MGVTNSRFFFALLSTCAAIGIGNMFLYPYFSYKLTGLFFIPYFIAMLVVGMPLLLLEFSAGQYFNKNVVDLFASVKKWLSSIGWLMIFNAFIVMSIYAVVFSWHIIYFFVSFGFQWKSNPVSYFFNNVIQASNGISQFYYLSLPVFVALIMAWLVLFFYIRNGFESVKKCALVSATALAVLLLFFFIYSLFLDNSLNGIYAFLEPDFHSIFKLETWVVAFSLAILSSGVAFGFMHAVARRSERGFVLGSSFIAAAFEIAVGVAFGFVVFAILGFLSAKQGISVDKLAFSDLSSTFTILSQALPDFYKPALLSLLFFVFLALFIVLGAVSLAYSLVHVLSQKLNTKKRNAAIVVAGFGFLFGLLFAIRPGIYIMDIVSHFAFYNILIAVLLETLAIGWLFESQKISDYIDSVSLLKIGGLWRFLVRYFIPIIILSLLILQINSDLSNRYNNYSILVLLIFGLGTIIVPLILAFLMPQKVLDRK